MAAGFHVQPIGRGVGVADAGKIGRDHRELLGKLRNDRLPYTRCLRVTVEQDHRWAMTCRQVVQLDTPDGGGA